MIFQFNTLKVLHAGNAILTVTLNRPERRNAISTEMLHELKSLWDHVSINQEKIRCIVLTGSGSAFCAGADLKERSEMTLATWQSQRVVFEQMMLAMLNCSIPIIAAVNGAAFGGGLELSLACDFMYSVNTATFSQSEVKLGLMPGALGTQNLPRALGLRRAKELALTGDIFTAEMAYSWGMINQITEPNLLMKAVLDAAHKIAENAPLAVIQTKKSLNMSQHLDLQSGFQYEIKAYNTLLTTKDREEGIRAFNEKRKPLYMGE